MRTTRYVRLSVLVFLCIAACRIAYAQTNLQFMSATPCRLVDTRPQYGGNGPIPAGTFQTFDLRQMAQACPGLDLSLAAAYSLNVTVVPEGFLGYLTIWPTGQPQPVVSTLNSVDGRVKANAAIVVAGTGGAVSVFVQNTTNVVLDIDGYFVPSTASALAFYPLTPCRIADTRPAYGGSGPIPGGTTQNFQVQSLCSVPTTALAYSLNFTAVPPGPLGYLTAWPAGGAQPVVSTLNDPTGTIVANAAIVGAGTNPVGDISVFPQNDTNLVIDINGYFAAPGTGGLSLYPLTNPCRVIDTRRFGDGMPFMGTMLIDVEGSPCMPPSLAQAYVMNATVVPVGSLGYLTLWPDVPDKPVASTLNAADGLITTNMAIVPTTDGKINAYASSLTQLVLDLSSYFAPLPPLIVTTTTLPVGTINTTYPPTQLTASGGEPPYSWSVIDGSLPSGLGLGSGGSISGTPTVGGLYNFTVQVADTARNIATAALSITIQAGGLVITTIQLPPGTVGLPYGATLGASGGTPPYMWTLAPLSGPLPFGLGLDMSSGLISGTPTIAGGSSFTVQVTDSSSPPVMSTAPLSISINGAITNAALSGPYAFSFNGYNGSPIVIAGSFIADGAGNITSGVLDSNSATGGPQQMVSLTGTYSIQANGVGTMTLAPLGGSPIVFSVAISNKGISGTSRNGYLIQRDPAHPNSYGSGVILVQNSLNFNLASLAGNYAFGYSGVDPSSKRVAGAGAFTTAVSGQVLNLVSGMVDTDDNGVLSTATFAAGQFTAAVDAHTGRGTAALTITGGSVRNYAFYVVSSVQIVMVSIDPISPADLTLWSIGQQHTPQGGFSAVSLNGVGVIEFNGVDVVSGSPVSEAEVGLLTTDGAGNGSVSIDQNDGGTLNQFSSSGTYIVAANGRVTLSSSFQTNPPVLYLVGQNQAFVVGTDSLVTSGILEAQSSPPFSNVSIIGQYLGGTVSPVLTSITNTAGAASGDGHSPMGDITFSLSSSGPSGPGSSQPTGTYTIDGTGRGVLTLNGSPAGITYSVSPQKFVLLPNTSGPVLSTFTRGSTP